MVIRELRSWTRAVQDPEFDLTKHYLLPLEGIWLRFMDHSTGPAIVTPWSEEGNLLTYVKNGELSTRARWGLVCSILPLKLDWS